MEIPKSVRFVVTSSIKFLLHNSLFLIAGTVIGLVWANVDSHSYEHVAHGELHFVVNDVLMCFFFAIAAKEIWEALLPGGALSSARKAATPLLATLGGVVGPALIFFGGTIWFRRPELARGWAIPCATDIAFSYLVARFVFGRRHPAIPFLLLLAIADDAIGLIILAIFYPTGELHLLLFLGCVVGAILFNLLVLRRLNVQNFWAYILIAGPLSWWGFHKGGIEPALALVPIIPTLPHEARDIGLFAEAELPEGERPMDSLNQFEHWWHNPVELILMLFGFANAGVVLGNAALATGLVSVGLLLGKPIGITLLTVLAVKAFKLEMPAGMNFRDVLVLGFMAGIGFTVALFVSTVAFPPGTTLDAAKLGALLSFSAAIVSFIASKVLRTQKLV